MFLTCQWSWDPNSSSVRWLHWPGNLWENILNWTGHLRGPRLFPFETVSVNVSVSLSHWYFSLSCPLPGAQLASFCLPLVTLLDFFLLFFIFLNVIITLIFLIALSF